MGDEGNSRPVRGLAAPRTAADVLLRPVAALLTSARGRLATVTAPAGFGKSTQVAAWAAEDGRATAWIDIGPADNDVALLVGTVLDALHHLSGTDPGAVTPAPSPVYPGMLGAVVGGALRACPRPFILVLDDVHLIEAQESIEVLDVLARHVPASSTLVLIARSEPDPALTRVRVHQGAVDVTADALALSTSQAAQVLEGLGVTLDEPAVEQLVQETEGWVVGLRLAALGILGGGDSIVGLHPDAAKYVHEEWLRGMSEADIDLLTQLAALDWLSGPLCDHVLGRTGTGAALQRLHETRLIVIPLDRRDDSYRMHRLLRDVLEASLMRTDPGAARRTHSRASEWFESHGDIDRAVHHALAANDLERAEHLVDAHTLAYQMRGHHATIAGWLEAFPDGHVTSQPSLCLLAAAAALGDPTRDGSTVAAWLRTGGDALARSPTPDPLTGLRFDALRALVDTEPIADGTARARRARDGLAPGIWHSIACLAHGALSFAAGDDADADELLTQAAAEAEVHGAPTTVAVSRAHLAILRSSDGDRERAAALARSARSLVERHRLDAYPTMVLVTAMAALVEAVDGNPDRAHDELLLARRQMTQMRGVAPWMNIQARIALARASLLLSDRSVARTLMQEAETLALRQPDAIRPKAQLIELENLMDATAAQANRTAHALTAAELRVLHYLPTNLTLADIADRLYVSRNTAKSHATAIYRKLGTRRRGDAVRIAESVGLLPPSERPEVR